MKRILFIAALTGTLLFFSAALFSGQASSLQQPFYVDTPYPVDTLGPTAEGYIPPATESPAKTASNTPGPSPTAAALLSATPLSSPTITLTATAGRNLFATEDTEMGSARVTPPASETPSPSRTASPMPTPSITAALPSEGQFQFSAGWFLAGLGIPAIGLLIIWVIYRARQSGEFS